jgi:hypothetical protein
MASMVCSIEAGGHYRDMSFVSPMVDDTVWFSSSRRYHKGQRTGFIAAHWWAFNLSTNA